MTYYEELGLGPRAEDGEIHKAYRNLARLLHPDQHAEAPLRQLAEAQMKRLNLVHDTLADPVRRRQYDASLAAPLALSLIRPRPGRHGLLLAGAALGVACLVWRVTDAPPRTGPRGSATAAATLAAPLPAPQSSRSKAARARRVAGRSEPALKPQPPLDPAFLAEVAPSPVPAPPSPPPELAVSPVVPLAALVTAPVLAAALPAPQRPVADPRFSGTWVYIPPRLPSGERDFYPPEFVEAVIQDSGDILRGRYRARYRVPDRPISPEVAFRFEGRARDGAATLNWSGAGGAEGEVKLTLLSAGKLRLDWLATSLGTQLGLASGTAVLTRRQDP